MREATSSFPPYVAGTAQGKRFLFFWVDRSVCKDLIEVRQAICVEQAIGLTDLYNRVDEGAWAEVDPF